MYPRFLRFLMALFISVSLLFCISPIHAQTKVTVNMFQYPPFCDDKGNGQLVDLIRAGFDEAGVKAEFAVYPVKRGIMLFFEGKSDVYCSFPIIAPDDRKKINFVNLTKTTVVGFYYKSRHEDFVYQNIKDLRNYKIGILVHSSSLPRYKQNGISVYQGKNPTQLFKMLDAGRVDVTESTLLSGALLLSRLFPEKVQNFDHVIFRTTDSGPAFLKASKRSQELKALFETGVSKMMKNGRYLSILESYWGKGNVPKANLPDVLQQFGVEKADMSIFAKAKRNSYGKIID